MNNYLKLIRPHQYVKNAFIFMPAFFAGSLASYDIIVSVILVFIRFWLLASSVYIINDFIDRKEDQKHPVKKNRPLASGAIRPENAGKFMMLLLAVASAFLPFIEIQAMLILLAYLVLNILYSLFFKNLAIIDVFIIASGFVLRLYAGAFATGIALSHWIIIMTFLLALFLALAKRRDDILLSKKGLAVRANIGGYSIEFISSSMSILAGVIMVCYIMYTTSSEVILKMHTNNLYLTAVFVLLGLFRFLQLTLVTQTSGNPTHILLADRPLQLAILCWLVSFSLVLYLPPTP